jgi:hypothetical protein
MKLISGPDGQVKSNQYAICVGKFFSDSDEKNVELYAEYLQKKIENLENLRQLLGGIAVF